jgi:hypothetical protein
MKLRSGFVSNSSSSSFVISCMPDQPLKITIEVDLSKAKIIKTEAELDAYFEYNYGDNWMDEEGEWALKRYEKMLVAIQAGKHIVRITGSNDDADAFSQFVYYGGIDNTVFPEGVELLENGN